MLPLPNAELVESSMEYFYGPKHEKTRVLLLETVAECQFRDVLAETFAPKPVPTIVVKSNKIAALERVRDELLLLRPGSFILLAMRLDPRFVLAPSPGKIWHGYHQGRYLPVSDPHPIIEAYRRRRATSPAGVPTEPALTSAELQQLRHLLGRDKEHRALIDAQKKQLQKQADEIEELRMRLAQQEVRHQSANMEVRGEITQLRLEIGKLKGKRRKTGDL